MLEIKYHACFSTDGSEKKDTYIEKMFVVESFSGVKGRLTTRANAIHWTMNQLRLHHNEGAVFGVIVTYVNELPINVDRTDSPYLITENHSMLSTLTPDEKSKETDS